GAAGFRFGVLWNLNSRGVNLALIGFHEAAFERVRHRGYNKTYARAPPRGVHPPCSAVNRTTAASSSAYETPPRRLGPPPDPEREGLQEARVLALRFPSLAGSRTSVFITDLLRKSLAGAEFKVVQPGDQVEA